MNEILIYIGIIFGVIGLSIFVGILKQKGYFNKQVAIDIADAVKLAQIIIKVYSYHEKVKNNTIIFDIADKVAKYVYLLADENVDKEKLAYDTTFEIIKQLQLSPTEDEKRMIEQFVSETFKWMKRSNLSS